MNRLTPKEKQRLWTHVYRNLELPAPLRPGTSSSGGTIESINSSNTKFSNHPSPDLKVSTLELHHTIRIDYPALEILNDPSERAILHKPINVQQRYQPLPLIADNDVYYHAGRDRAPTTQYFSLYRATSDRPSRRVMSKFLHPDVREATKYHGKTRLSVVIFMTPHDLSLQVRVQRKTTYFLNDGYEDHDTQQYNLMYDEFFSQRNEAQWYQDILQLVTMKDDRSARYVQFKLWMLEGQKFPGAIDLSDRFYQSWRPRRQPDYEVYLNNIVTEVKRSSLLKSKACKLCKNPFKGDSHKPVALPCCNKLVSKQCLLEWCQVFNAKILVPDFHMPWCPSCKTPIFKDPRTLEHLKFGVLADQYWRDDRYTVWENFERSCADLDKVHASKSRTEVSINSVVLGLIWNKMADATTRHNDPPHLQPRLYPEFRIFEKELAHHFQCLGGITTTLSNLYTFLANAIEREFLARFQKARLDQYLPPGARGWVGRNQIRDLMWRDGFSEFVSRVLNRTLMFFVLRRCNCKQDVDVHWDGGREFWNPERFEGRVVGDWDAERRRKWQRSEAGRRYIKAFLEADGR